MAAPSQGAKHPTVTRPPVTDMPRERPHFPVTREQRLWIEIRLLGWLLIGVWQLLSLLSEFWPIVDVNAKTMRVTGKLLGFLGLVLVALGFERLMHLTKPADASS